MKKRQVLSIIMIFLISVLFVACTPQRSPKKQEEPSTEEPTIKLYVAETEEIKEIKLEEYLQGVVAAEMDPEWPKEALAAQAIIARTFTLSKIEEGGVPSRGSDASTDIEEFQAYNAERVNDNVINAVKKTRGEVVKYQGNLIKTWFHADAGGKTATAEEGLGYTESPTPYIQVVEDPGQKITTEENKKWQLSIPLSEVSAAVAKVKGQDPGNLTAVAILEKGPSGRATRIKFNEVEVSAPAFRLALGSTKMRSTLLTEIKIANGQLIIIGQGYGHGVGMSQWGARALAEDGKTAEEIVQYFFQGIEISKEYK